MGTHSVRNRTDAYLEECRRCAASLVERAQISTGSRMAAYDVVARQVGTSSMWLRRFIGRYSAVPSFPVGMNIVSAYQRCCTRVEQETNRANQSAAFIEETIREVTAQAMANVEGAAARAQGAARLSRSRVPGMDEGVDETR